MNDTIQADRQLTREEAIKLSESGFWEGMEAYDIALFQLFQGRLCMPIGVFKCALNEALGRPVYTHELAQPESLQAELLGVRPAPSLTEIVDLIPEEKRVVIDPRA